MFLFRPYNENQWWTPLTFTVWKPYKLLLCSAEKNTSQTFGTK